jgi:hypothetical protein
MDSDDKLEKIEHAVILILYIGFFFNGIFCHFSFNSIE